MECNWPAYRKDGVLMRDSEYKIYVYHKLDTIDILNCAEWARNNFDHYEGLTSPLWNEHVQNEFKHISKERKVTT